MRSLQVPQETLHFQPHLRSTFPIRRAQEVCQSPQSLRRQQREQDLDRSPRGTA
ncbi:unnamed protein product [Linum tenue]|uniref:Uncharacterized protein n=1 Tax=Linum tenue TaxID=586396 RepID=A0AAV0MDB1_9ROSI|nr:unnamed protein product [Linum tenue]